MSFSSLPSQSRVAKCSFSLRGHVSNHVDSRFLFGSLQLLFLQNPYSVFYNCFKLKFSISPYTKYQLGYIKRESAFLQGRKFSKMRITAQSIAEINILFLFKSGICLLYHFEIFAFTLKQM